MVCRKLILELVFNRKEITHLVEVQLIQDALGAPNMLVGLVVVQGHIMEEGCANLVIVA